MNKSVYKAIYDAKLKSSSNNDNDSSPVDNDVKFNNLLANSYRLNSRATTRKIKGRRKRKGEIFLTSIENKPIQTRSMRYLSSTNDSTSVLVSNLLSLLLTTTSVSTSAFRLFEAARIRSVSITALGESNNTGVGFYSFSWDGQFAPHSEDEGIFATGVPFRKTYFPPEGALASFWQSDDVSDLTQSLFTVTIGNTDGTIIMDISFEYVLLDGTAPAVTLGAVATVTGISALTLSSGSDDFVPLGLVPCTL